MIAILVLAAIGVLVWNARDTRNATAEGLRATRGLVIADQAAVALLGYRRLRNVWVATTHRHAGTDNPELAPALAQQAAEVRRLFRLLAQDVKTPEERALVEAVGRGFASYVAVRERSEAQTDDLPTIIATGAPDADAVAASLESLRELHRAQVDRAYAAMDRSAFVADVVGFGVAAAFLLALRAVLYGARRWIVAPVLALHGAIDALRQGRLEARAPEVGVSEICDLARVYNAMADTLMAQREGQLTYLAGVAHDLRNPLAAMKVGLGTIEREEGTERGRRTLSLLVRQCDRMTRMIGDLLDASRIQAGRLELVRERVDLRERARDAVALLAPLSPEHAVVLDVPDEPVLVNADPGRIDQVANNLLSNALKFSPGRCRVDVRVRVRGPDAVLEVQDRGIGMTPEEMRDLYAPFRRRAPEVAPGVGLGLSVAQKIVEAHGGRIEVESAPKVGSTFRIVLPKAEG